MELCEHRISSLEIKLAVSALPDALSARSKLQSMWDQSLLSVFDEKFDQWLPHDEWVHLSQLHLKIHADSVEQLLEQLPNQLRIALSDEISRIELVSRQDNFLDIDKSGAVSNQSSAVQIQNWTEIDIVRYYLSNGHLPWFVVASEFNKQQMADIVTTNIPSLVNYLVESASAIAWFRLVDLALFISNSEWIVQVIKLIQVPSTVSRKIYAKLIRQLVEESQGEQQFHQILQVVKLLSLLTNIPTNKLFFPGLGANKTTLFSQQSWDELINSIDWTTEEKRLLTQSGQKLLVASPDLPTQFSPSAVSTAQIADNFREKTQLNNSMEHGMSTGNFLRDTQGVDNLPFIITHAGLVIIAPYLERFFNACGIVSRQGRIPIKHMPRAAALLYLIATGSEHCSEFDLGMIKILLGVSLDSPLAIARGLLTKSDKVEADALLQSIISHWSVLGKLSADGLRQSFLDRSGLINETEDFWSLTFERVGHDVLLNRLPWNISLIALPWIQKPINVTW